MLVHLVLCGWQRVAAQASRRRAQLERCIEGAARSRAHNALQTWRGASREVTMALLPSRCAAAAAAALLDGPARAMMPPGWVRAAVLLKAINQEEAGAVASTEDREDIDGEAAYEPFASPSAGGSAAGRSARESLAHGSPQYRPFEPPPRADEVGRQQQAVVVSSHGQQQQQLGAQQPPLDDAVVEEVKAAVCQLAAWLNETAAWLPSRSSSMPASLPASPPLVPNDEERGAGHVDAFAAPPRAATAPPSRASLAASRSTRAGMHDGAVSPRTFVPRPGLAPRRLLLGASRGGGDGGGGEGSGERLKQQLQQRLRQIDDAQQLQPDETMPAWLQSAADAVAHAAAADGREAPHAAALLCARRWGLENAVLLARESRQWAALRGWREALQLSQGES